MLRDVTIRMNLPDGELAKIVPSVTLNVEIFNHSNALSIDVSGEIITVKDVHEEDEPSA